MSLMLLLLFRMFEHQADDNQYTVSTAQPLSFIARQENCTVDTAVQFAMVEEGAMSVNRYVSSADLCCDQRTICHREINRTTLASFL